MFDTARLETIREMMERARAVAVAKAAEHGHAGETGEQKTQLRRVVKLEEYSASLADAMAEIGKLRKRRTPSLAPCTREEAHEYGATLGMPKSAVDPWFDHFESNGWRVSGRAPMKDWKAGLRNGCRIWRRGGGDMKGKKLAPDQDPEGWPEWLEGKNMAYVAYRTAKDWLKADFRKFQKGPQ